MYACEEVKTNLRIGIPGKPLQSGHRFKHGLLYFSDLGGFVLELLRLNMHKTGGFLLQHPSIVSLCSQLL